MSFPYTQWLKAATVALAMFAMPLTAAAQQSSNFWYFGENAGLDFNSGSPVAVTNGQVSTSEGCASVSDASGSLLFYTDGITVYNSNHQVMANGVGLLGQPGATHSAVALKKIGSVSEYYIFTIDFTSDSDGIRYSIVDMSLNGGLGAVTTKNTVIEADIRTERIALAPHSNGTDFWLLSARGDGTQLAFLINAAGIAATPVTSAGTSFDNPFLPFQDIGYMRVSPDADTVVSAGGLSGFFDIFSFNASTGALTKRATINVPNAENSPDRERPYGVEFSPNSDLVYVTSLRYNAKITQYDLTVTDSQIESSGVILTSHTTDTPTSTRGRMGALSLGPDAKIYVSIEGETSLSVIDSPNVKGLGAGFVFNAVSLDGRRARLGLPNFATSFAPPVVVIEQPADDSATTDQTPTVSGTVNVGDSVEVTITDSNGVVVQTVNPTPNAQGEWEFDAMTLPEGEYVITAVSTNPISEDTADASPVAFAVDLTDPDVEITAPADGAQTNDTTPTVSGTTDDDADVSVSVLDGAMMVVCAGVVTPANGAWSLDCPTELADGDYTVTATTADKAGNSDTDGPVSFSVDASAPPVAITSPTSNETVTNTLPTITGTADPGQEVVVSIDGAVVGTVIADAQGDWELPLTTPLDLGQHTASATVEDTTGNQGTSGDVVFTVADATTGVVITGPTGGSTVTGPTVVVTGTGKPGAVVTVTFGGQTQTTTVEPDGTWSIPFDDVTPGAGTITADSEGGSDSVDVTVVSPDDIDLIVAGGACEGNSTTGGAAPPSGALWMLLFVMGGLFMRRRR